MEARSKLCCENAQYLLLPIVSCEQNIQTCLIFSRTYQLVGSEMMPPDEHLSDILYRKHESDFLILSG